MKLNSIQKDLYPLKKILREVKVAVEVEEGGGVGTAVVVGRKSRTRSKSLADSRRLYVSILQVLQPALSMMLDHTGNFAALHLIQDRIRISIYVVPPLRE